MYFFFHHIVIISFKIYVINIMIREFFSKKISKYLERILISYPSQMIRMTNLVRISEETSNIDNR